MNKSESKYFSTALLMDEALLYLLEKKDFEFITVKEICKKAGVNRSTFYLHYESVNDLLQESVEMINKRFLAVFNGKDDITNNIESLQKEDLNFITPEYLTPYLEFIKENKRIFKTIHRLPELFGVEKTFSKMNAEIFKPVLRKYGVAKDEQEYIFEFFFQGILAIVMKWVALDCADEVEHVQNVILGCVSAENHMKNDD